MEPKRKGLIVIGYTGIGKSTIGGIDNCIDLESGCFWVGDRRATDWYIPYCQLAMDLANQGYNVLISSHRLVVQYMESVPRLENVGAIVVVCPQKSMKDIWLERLEKRYNETKTYKDYRSLHRAKDQYQHDIRDLLDCCLPVMQIDDLEHYSLRGYIHKARSMWCLE